MKVISGDLNKVRHQSKRTCRQRERKLVSKRNREKERVIEREKGTKPKETESIREMGRRRNNETGEKNERKTEKERGREKEMEKEWKREKKDRKRKSEKRDKELGRVRCKK